MWYSPNESTCDAQWRFSLSSAMSVTSLFFGSRIAYMAGLWDGSWLVSFLTDSGKDLRQILYL